ncbi:MAG TPA: Virginiamycin B lyase [Ktedonobacteraceae bacterium]
MQASRRSYARILPGSFALACLFIALIGVLPAAAGTIKKFTVPTAGSSPNGITTGPEGALWFTEAGSGKIGRVTTSGAITELTLTGGSASGFGSHPITKGPDGALWFVEQSTGTIGRLTTTGVFSQFNLPGNINKDEVIESAKSITAGPDGALWFTSQNKSPVTFTIVSGQLGRITTSGSITEFTLPSGGTRRTTPHPIDITTGPDGALWFTDPNLSKIGRITTSGSLTQFTSPQADPIGITTGPDGASWFTATFFPAAKVGRVTTAGVFTIFTIASSADGVSAGESIATGPDGKLWFSDYDSTLSRGSILSITTAGTVKAFPFPTLNVIDGITAGPDAKMWFTSTNLSTNVGSVGNITTS